MYGFSELVGSNPNQWKFTITDRSIGQMHIKQNKNLFLGYVRMACWYERSYNELIYRLIFTNRMVVSYCFYNLSRALLVQTGKIHWLKLNVFVNKTAWLPLKMYVYLTCGYNWRFHVLLCLNWRNGIAVFLPGSETVKNRILLFVCWTTLMHSICYCFPKS